MHGFSMSKTHYRAGGVAQPLKVRLTTKMKKKKNHTQRVSVDNAEYDFHAFVSL